jgi:tRNA (guanosine-2'-O-)-methyltransferase
MVSGGKVRWRAVSTPRRFRRVRAVLDRRQPDLTVLMEEVQVPRNLAAILRSADAVGVLEAHAVWAGGRLKLSRPASGGTRKWVPVRRHPTLDAALAHLAAGGFRVLAAHPAPGAADFREVDYTRPTAILVGTEETGVSEAAARRADGWIAIPMEGMGTSLNVSVAAALILFEAQRQRAAAGFYDRPRLEPETHARLLFEWTYPTLAAFCRRKKAPYPRLSPEGEILDPIPRG